MDFERIRSEFPIVELMARMGCDLSHRGNMYRAPYREDSEPSMSVDPRRNVWCDFGRTRSDGTPLGGGNIELVKETLNLSTNLEAANKILELFQSHDFEHSEARQQQERPTNYHREEPAIHVVSSLNTISSKALQYYLRQRCINPTLGSRWCNEVDFIVGGRQLFALGFRNDRGCWALRNSFWKGSTGQGVSTIIKDRGVVGAVTPEALASFPDAGKGRVALFEGFMDFLSWLTLERTQTPPCDALVLNSTSNLREALPFLRTHDSIDCFLDNDDAGRQCLQMVRDQCPESVVNDMAGRYAIYKDLNDYLICETQNLERGQTRGMKIR